MRNIIIRFWSWLKSLFPGYFSEHQTEQMQETDPLFVADNAPPHSPEPERKQSSAIIHFNLQKPVTLTPEESALVIHYAEQNQNEFIDSLSIEKKMLAYDLIQSFVNHNINNIDRDINTLVNEDRNTGKLRSSWHRVRYDFQHGHYSECSIIASCEKVMETCTTKQLNLLNNIIHYFQLCKNMLKLNLCKQQFYLKQLPRIPTREESELEMKRNETRENARTLAILDKFHQRCIEADNERDDTITLRRRKKM